MAQDKQISKGEIYLSRFLRGSAKAIPGAGPLLEELLFNAGDEIEAKEQAADFVRRFEELQSNSDNQSLTIAQVLELTSAQVQFMGAMTDRLDELLSISRAIGPASVSPALAEAARISMERVHGALPPIWSVPHIRNPNFTGRAEPLDRLRSALTSGRPAAVTQAIAGLGGVGKTQLAVEYAYRNASDYAIVWWVRSEEATTLAADYAALAAELGLPEKDAADLRISAQAVRRWLEQTSGWLLVFDNAPESANLRSYIPGGNTGHVLITSRSQAWGAVAEPLQMHEFERAESLEFLLSRTGQDDEAAANALADTLGDLPLALEQAAAYMKQRGQTIEAYVALFEQRHREHLERGAPDPDQYPDSVATTWHLSFQRVEEASLVAADLLRLIAYLAPDDIPRELITGGQEHLPVPLSGVVNDTIVLDDALAVLRRYSLVEVADESLSVHRLVQAVTRDRIDDIDRKKWAEAAVEIVDSAFPFKENSPETWAGSALLLPHALAVATHAEDAEVALESTGHLLNSVGLYLGTRAEFSSAKSALERALTTNEDTYGPDHDYIATTVNNLGTVLRALGDLESARAHFERALTIGEETYGPDHPNVAIRVNNLGGVLRAMGDLEGARAHFERAQKIDEAADGPDDSRLATSINNLGSVLLDMGELEAARDQFERALRMDEATYGPEHPNVAIRLNNMGAVLQHMGNLEEARAYHEQALKIDEAAFGPDHASLAVKINNLGSVLQEFGDLQGARGLFERALRIDEQTYGSDHPSVTRDVNNLGSVLGAMGILESARSYFERALGIVQERLGDEHPNTVGVRDNLRILEDEMRRER